MSLPPDMMARESAMSLPTFLRRNKKPRVEADHLEPVLERLFQTTGTLEADGGLPGATPEERIVRTLAALVALLDYEDKLGGGLFTTHIGRMTEFLQAQGNDSLSPERIALVRHILDSINKNLLTPGEWSKEYSGFGDKIDTKELLNWLAKMF